MGSLASFRCSVGAEWGQPNVVRDTSAEILVDVLLMSGVERMEVNADLLHRGSNPAQDAAGHRKVILNVPAAGVTDNGPGPRALA